MIEMMVVKNTRGPHAKLIHECEYVTYLPYEKPFPCNLDGPQNKI